MEKIFFLGLGGFLGTVGRYLVSLGLQQFSHSYFYLATLTVNLTGSMIIGFLSALFLRDGFLHPGFRLFFITGVLGGFTTFSSFSLETLRLIQEGRVLESITYIMISITGGVCFAALGWFLSGFIPD